MPLPENTDESPMEPRATGFRAVGPEICAGLVLLGFAVFYGMQANALPRSALGGSVGASGLPEVLALALGLLSVLLIGQNILRARRTTAEPTPASAEPPESRLRALGVWLIGAAAVFVLPYAGYPVTVALLLLAIAIFYGRRLSLGLLAFAVGGAVIFSLLFIKLLSVPMPMGFLAGLLSR